MESSKKKITFKKLLELNNDFVALNYAKKNRLANSLWQMREYMKYPFEQYNERITDMNIELASTDGDGNFYLDASGNPIYTKFTKENSKKREIQYKKLLEDTVEVEVKYCQDLKLVKELPLPFIKGFNGFLFNVTDDEIEQWMIEAEEIEAKKEKSTA